MLGEESAAALLNDSKPLVDVWGALPNRPQYYTQDVETLVFVVRDGGREPGEHYVKQRSGEKSWALSLSGFEPLKGRNDIEHARISSKKAASDGVSLSGDDVGYLHSPAIVLSNVRMCPLGKVYRASDKADHGPKGRVFFVRCEKAERAAAAGPAASHEVLGVGASAPWSPRARKREQPIRCEWSLHVVVSCCRYGYNTDQTLMSLQRPEGSCKESQAPGRQSTSCPKAQKFEVFTSTLILS
jgi:hypothetical protein